jgi:hypothetical protein
VRLGEDLPRPAVAWEPHATEDPDVIRIKAALLDGVPANPSSRSGQQQARALLADLIGWHRREAKPAWWRYFYVRTLSPADLIGEPDALGGLTGGGIVAKVNRSVVLRSSFPPQEHGFSTGQTVFDPVTGQGWTVWGVDDEHGTIDLKIGKNHAGPLPVALAEGGPVDTRTQAQRLRDPGDRVTYDGLTGQDTATALLLRQRPGGTLREPLRRDGETATGTAIRLALALDDSFLPIQGPPGTGKTFTAARQILKLTARGRTVGITGPSHAVIHNLIGALCAHAAGRGMSLRIGQRADKGNPYLHPAAARMTYDTLAQALSGLDLDVAAGTTWMSRDQFTGSVDTLFVDEAGQMSLANVLAVAGAARSLVLLGDPQQLAQPSHATHPPGAVVSTLEHILGEHATMPVDAGLLLDETWRMHPQLCQFTSEVFYDGKLASAAGLENQEILGDLRPSGSGLHVLPVPHQGNSNASPEEARQVARLIRGLAGRQWRDRHGETFTLGPDQILVVTPYNAQIRPSRMR